MAHLERLEDKLVVLIGGGGFLGTHLAQELLGRGARLRIADRHPEKAFRLKPLANLGQLQFTHCNVRHRASLEAAITGAHAVVYLVGTFGADQEQLQADGAGLAAEISRAAGAKAFGYVSALGADPRSESNYARTKAEGERRVLAAFPHATIVRPSVLFGEGDKFISMLAGIVRMLPIVPVIAPHAGLQLLWVDDAAEAIANALSNPDAHGGKTYEIAGPEVLTMAQIMRGVAAAQDRKRVFIHEPDAVVGAFAALPGTPISSDQWALLKAGSKASGDLPGCRKLGVTPRPLELFLDRWMTRYRKHGRFTEATELA